MNILTEYKAAFAHEWSIAASGGPACFMCFVALVVLAWRMAA